MESSQEFFLNKTVYDEIVPLALEVIIDQRIPCFSIVHCCYEFCFDFQKSHVILV